MFGASLNGPWAILLRAEQPLGDFLFCAEHNRPPNGSTHRHHHGARRAGRARPTRPQTAQRRLHRLHERCAPPDAKRRSSTMAGRLIIIHRTLTVGNADRGRVPSARSPGRRDDGCGAYLAIVDLGACGRASARNTRPIAIFDTARDVQAVEAFRKKNCKSRCFLSRAAGPPPRTPCSNSKIHRPPTCAWIFRR